MRNEGHIRRKPAEPTPTWSDPSRRPEPTPQPTLSPQPAPQAEAAAPLEEQVPLAPAYHFATASLYAEPQPAAAAPDAPPPADPPALDTLGGNSRQIAGWLSASFAEPGPTVQASLRVNAPGDVYEQEADRMADLVMRSPAGPDDAQPTSAPAMPSYYVQRTASGAGLDVSPQVEGNISRMRGGGQALPASERSFFENRFGHDFSQIRIHSDHHAAETARSLNARAFTVGTDIAFDAGEYQPGTESGRHLLAHELTHTIQQTGGVATKRVQRKAADEEQAGGEQPVEELAKQAAETLSEAEVEQEQVSPIEGQEVELPEVEPKGEGGEAGGDGGDAGAADAAPAPAAAQAAAADDKQAQPGDAAPAPAAAPAAAADDKQTQPGDAVPAPAAAQAAAADDKQTQPTPAPAPAPDGAAGDSTPVAPTAADTTASAAQVGTEATQAGAALGQTGTPAQPQAAASAAPGQADAPTAQAPGAPVPAERSADEDKDETRIQRMPAGRSIQRAPRSPDADPAFQQVVSQVKANAASQKRHPSAQQKASEAAAAAQMPSEEKQGAAQNTQTGELDATAAAQVQAAQGGKAPGFDEATFVAAVRKRIDELTPTDPKQMEDIKNNPAFGSGAKQAVDEKVQEGKKQAQGPVGDKLKEAPNTSAVADKPTTALPGNPPGAAPGAPDARGAAPKAKGPEEVEQPVRAQSQQLDNQLAQANITEEQLRASNEPKLVAAADSKKQFQEQAQQSAQSYRAAEQSQIQGAQAQAGQTAQTGMAVMHQDRAAAFNQIDTLQNGAKGKDEDARTKIGTEINNAYNDTKQKVDETLKKLGEDVEKTFASGADKAKQSAVDYVNREVKAYLDKRYASDKNWWDVGAKLEGAAHWVGDLAGMPPEYHNIYREGRRLYIEAIEQVLHEVAKLVGQGLKDAHDEVKKGRDKIAEIVNKQPAHLREVAQEAASDAQSQFDSLDETIDDKQQELVDGLAQQYVEKLQELDSALQDIKDQHKTLGEQAQDAVKGAIDTIEQFRKLLESTLKRAAAAVELILKDPVKFLGHLIDAVKQGLNKFVGNIGKHLQNGLVGWLTGTLAAGGIQLPTTWDLAGIFSLVMQILGLTQDVIEAKIAKALGPKGPQIIGAVKQGFEVLSILATKGLGGLWSFVQDQIGDLKTMVMDEIKQMVITQVIEAGVNFAISMLGGPAGAAAQAVQAIVHIITWLVQNGEQALVLINSVIDSITRIATGDIGGAADYIERSLGQAVPIIISLLANLLNLGGLVGKVQSVIKKVRAIVQKPIDKIIKKAVALGKKLLGKLGIGKKGRRGQQGEEPEDQQSTPAQQQAGLAALHQAERKYMQNGAISRQYAEKAVNTVKRRYPVFKALNVIDGSDRWNYSYVFRAAGTEYGLKKLKKNVEKHIKDVHPQVQSDVRELVNRPEMDGRSWQEIVQILRNDAKFSMVYKYPLSDEHAFGREMYEVAKSALKDARKSFEDKHFDADITRSLGQRIHYIHENKSPYGPALQKLQSLIFQKKASSTIKRDLINVFRDALTNESRGIRSADDVFANIASETQEEIIEAIEKADEPKGWVAVFAAPGRQVYNSNVPSEDRSATIGDLWKQKQYKVKDAASVISAAIRSTLARYDVSTDDIEGEIDKAGLRTADYMASQKIFLIQATDIPRYLKAAGNSKYIKKCNGKSVNSSLYKSRAEKYKDQVGLQYGQEIHHAVPLYLGGSHNIDNLLNVYGKAREKISKDAAESTHYMLHEWIDSMSLAGYIQTQSSTVEYVKLETLRPSDIDKIIKQHGAGVLIGTLFDDGTITYQETSIQIPKKASISQTSDD